MNIDNGADYLSISLISILQLVPILEYQVDIGASVRYWYCANIT